MRRLSTIALLALVMSAVAATTASAAVPVAWQQKALATAQRVWQPGCGALQLRFADPDAEGLVVVNDAPGHGELVHGALGFTARGACVLGINSTVDWRALGYPTLCTIVLHEGGRAAGMTGTNGPGIMRTDIVTSHDEVTGPNGRTRLIYSGADRRCVRPSDHRLASDAQRRKRHS